ncbi:MAG: DUF120 domain-containing protein [Candidatus Magasanikbacteria bacterium]
MKTLSGEVFSGLGEAQNYLSFKPYQEKIDQLVGFRPFAGTLNLKVNPKELNQLKQKVACSRIDEFGYKSRNCSALDIYPIKLPDTDAAYIDIEITDYGDDVMEIIAPINLREELNLYDGDVLEIKY